MPYARIWYQPSGGVLITYFLDGSDPETVSRVLREDGHVARGATFEDVASEAELQTLIPQDRSQREKWRKNPSGRGVRIDPTVPSRRPQ